MKRSIDERRGAGRARRADVSRSMYDDWDVALRVEDPIAVLERQAEPRVPELRPIRYERMAESPFAFFRGAAAVMASDLAVMPTTGIRVQACGDAHVDNFGLFASPERNLVFDINDFDETVPGPWEWDVLRLCTSLHVVARQRGFSPKQCDDVTRDAARTYRGRVADYSTWRVLDLWYERTEIKAFIEHFPKRYRAHVTRDVKRAWRKDHLRAVDKLTTVVDGHRRFVEDPPLVVHAENSEVDAEMVHGLVDAYRANLADERRQLFDRYRLVDVARKVVGVGSVGTRCWIALFEGPDDPARDLIVLQVKEATTSVLEPHVGASAFTDHGQRVVVGQRLVQAASDVFLAWANAPQSQRHYYVRQLWDLKGKSDPMAMDLGHLRRHGELCAWVLARSHARTGDAVEITGYLGKGTAFDDAVTAFARRYASVNEQDHARLVARVAP
ncbi:MAG: DUF2252 domain-containing protein [Acidimicrobiia bacterium]